MRIKPSVHQDEPTERPWSQVLVIEIDTAADCFNGKQTPAVCSLIEGIATTLERSGIQLTKLPWDITAKEWTDGGDDIIATVDLVEGNVPTIAESFAQLVDRARAESEAALTTATESGWDPFEHDPDPLPDLVIRYRKARHRHEFLKGVLADYEALVGEDK